MTLTSFNTDSNQSVGDTRSTDAPNGASAGAKAPAATSPSGGGGGSHAASVVEVSATRVVALVEEGAAREVAVEVGAARVVAARVLRRRRR